MMTAKTVETSRVNKLLCTAAVVLSFIMKILPLNKSNVIDVRFDLDYERTLRRHGLLADEPLFPV
jgi:hypothetical protein